MPSPATSRYDVADADADADNLTTGLHESGGPSVLPPAGHGEGYGLRRRALGASARDHLCAAGHHSLILVSRGHFLPSFVTLTSRAPVCFLMAQRTLNSPYVSPRVYRDPT